MKRYLAIGLAVILLLSLGTVILSCAPGKASVAGTYVCQHYPDDYLELHEDGTFYLEQTEMYALQEINEEVTGEWEAEENQLRLYAKSCRFDGVETPMRSVFTLEIKGNKIYDEDGRVWVKR